MKPKCFSFSYNIVRCENKQILKNQKYKVFYKIAFLGNPVTKQYYCYSTSMIFKGFLYKP